MLYCEKPFAETMEDNRLRLKHKGSDKIVQIGSQRRSGANYHGGCRLYTIRKVWPYKNGGVYVECKPARTLAQAGFSRSIERRRYRLETLVIEQARGYF